MAHIITPDEWLQMFDASGEDIVPDFLGSYTAISYITLDTPDGEPLDPFKALGAWITARGLERDDLEGALAFIAAQGRNRIWLDVFSLPKTYTNMSKVKRTYKSAGVVYGGLNRADSYHLRLVLL
jgi:hypothetical protein